MTSKIQSVFNSIYDFCDHIEDKVRGKLSHYPILYAFVGGTGIVIFWRGVWHTMDFLMDTYFSIGDSASTTSLRALPWWDGPLSIVIGTILLLTVGLFVTTMIGNEIIISGLKREKKIVEKTEDELEVELIENEGIKDEIHDMDSRLSRIEKLLKNK